MMAKRKCKLDEAKRLADELTRIYSDAPISPISIAAKQGVIVRFTDFGKYARDISGICDFNNRVVRVNHEDGFEQRSLTMAHELGHLLLHEDEYTKNLEGYSFLPRFRPPNIDDPCENEAETFAEHLLVPKRILAPFIKEGVADLSAAFGVPYDVMERRLQTVKDEMNV